MWATRTASSRCPAMTAATDTPGRMHCAMTEALNWCVPASASPAHENRLRKCPYVRLSCAGTKLLHGRPLGQHDLAGRLRFPWRDLLRTVMFISLRPEHASTNIRPRCAFPIRAGGSSPATLRADERAIDSQAMAMTLVALKVGNSRTRPSMQERFRRKSFERTKRHGVSTMRLLSNALNRAFCAGFDRWSAGMGTQRCRRGGGSVYEANLPCSSHSRQPPLTVFPPAFTVIRAPVTGHHRYSSA